MFRPRKVSPLALILPYIIVFPPEIVDYAEYLGVDLTTEPYLREHVVWGLCAPLPRGWRPVYVDDVITTRMFSHGTQAGHWERGAVLLQLRDR